MNVWNRLRLLPALLATMGVPAYAAVTISSITPSLASPQELGTSITWTVKGTDSAKGPLTFQFNITPPNGIQTLVKDFNVGTSNGSVWTAQPFVWVPTTLDGVYQIIVVAQDFTTGSTASQTASYSITPLATGSTSVATATANPLVALFSAPACASGSLMRVSFQPKSGSTPAVTTNWSGCHPPSTMNFEIGGMYPSTTYSMTPQILTKGVMTSGAPVTFTTGPLPADISFPSLAAVVPAGSSTDTTDSLLLLTTVNEIGNQPLYPNLASDLSGKIMWYLPPVEGTFITRPLPGGTLLTIQNGKSWNTVTNDEQVLRLLDLEGNLVKETNTGVIQSQLVALGATDGGPCGIFPSPAPVGSACLDSFTHDAIEFSIGSTQYTAALCNLEKIFPAGTQGNTTGLPVDIRGLMILVLDSNWQVVWWWDSFDPAGGGNGYPLLPITRVATLNETCLLTGPTACEGLQLVGPGIAPLANDWLHPNTIYYWPTDTSGGASGDLVWSSRNQDWVIKVDYNNGAGTGDILWTMGPCGTFTFNNTYNDPWPWFSGQHDVTIANNGAGPMTIFDDGDTRVSPPGSSTQCVQGVGSGDNRGMALTLDESTLTVNPVLSADLMVYSSVNGSAQLLSNGDYLFLPGVVAGGADIVYSYSIEILPTAGTDTGKQVLNIRGPEAYRSWQMPSFYAPPAL